MYKHFFKRFIDVAISVLILIILMPLISIVFLILYIVNNGKPLFIQVRPGKDAKHFKLFKFKTMNEKRDKNGILLPDNKRLTKTGKFLRKTSFDEIPQLLNVLKGDMSLIGPRPLLIEYLPLYDKNQKRRHNVKPGITGWAQVNGRNFISWQQKFELDIFYIDNYSFYLDLKIVLLTIVKIFKSEGINQKGQATMQAFKGN